MRGYFVLITLLFIASSAFSQKNLERFITDLKTTDEFAHWKIPTKVIKSGIKLGFKKSEIESNINKLTDGILKVNQYETEIHDMDEQKISKIIEGHKRKLIKKDSFSERLHFKDDDENVSVLTLENNNKIIKILLLHQKKYEIQLYELLTNIEKSEFEKLMWRKEYKKI